MTFSTQRVEKQQGKQVLGIDLGIKHLATMSDGTKIERPNLRAEFLQKMRKIERTRKFARRKASKTKKYGKLPKARQVANIAAKIANKRQDYLHKESTNLVKRSETIVIGKLPLKFINKNRRLSGISYDSGIGLFKNMLHYKAIGAGVAYIEVSERYSTQTCSFCGVTAEKSSGNRIGLEVREWTCENCGECHDRDINSARNILRTGLCTPNHSATKVAESRESPTSKHKLKAIV